MVQLNLKVIASKMFCKLLLISWIVSLNVSFAFDSFPIKIANENSLKRHKLHSEKACENDLNMFNDAFEKREVWALKCKRNFIA